MTSALTSQTEFRSIIKFARVTWKNVNKVFGIDYAEFNVVRTCAKLPYVIWNYAEKTCINIIFWAKHETTRYKLGETNKSRFIFTNSADVELGLAFVAPCNHN